MWPVLKALLAFAPTFIFMWKNGNKDQVTETLAKKKKKSMIYDNNQNTMKIKIAETFHIFPWKGRLINKTKQDKKKTTRRQF